MIYCPNCSKPSARDHGPCPHCGVDLKDGSSSGTDSRESVQTSHPETAPVESSASLISDIITSDPDPSIEDVSSPTPDPGLDIQPTNLPMEPDGIIETPTVSDDSAIEIRKSGLELDSFDSLPPQTVLGAPIEKNVSKFAVQDVARFGSVDSGVVGTIKYWLHVRKRLGELAVEYDEAQGKERAAKDTRLALLSELGKKAYEIGIDSKSIAELISQARLLQAELRGLERRHLDLESDYQTKMGPLDEKMKQLEAEAEPFVKQEEQVTEELNKLFNNRKGVQTKKKRTEIELRNIDDLIAKRQAKYADLELPKEERDKLLKEISTFDNKRPGIIEQMETCEKELEALETPIVEMETKHGEIRGLMNEKRTEIGALNTEIDSLSKSFSGESNEMNRKLETESEKVNTAWAKVGERVILERCETPEIEGIFAKAMRAMQDVTDLEMHVEILARAQDSYDLNVVTRAKQLVAGAAVAVVVIIGLLIFLT